MITVCIIVVRSKYNNQQHIVLNRKNEDGNDEHATVMVGQQLSPW